MQRLRVKVTNPRLDPPENYKYGVIDSYVNNGKYTEAVVLFYDHTIASIRLDLLTLEYPYPY